MSYIVDRLLGIIIDEKSCVKREFNDRTVSRYKVIGLKGFKVNNFTTVTLGLQKLDDSVAITGLKSFTGKYLFIEEYKDGRPNTYCVNNKNCFNFPIKCDGVLPVYNKSDELLYSLNDDMLYMGYVCSSINNIPLDNIRVKLDIKSKTVEIVLSEYSNKLKSYFSFKHTPVNNFKVRNVYDYELSSMFDNCGDGLYRYGSIYKVSEMVSNNFIVPKDCKYLIVHSSSIDSLVINDSLEYIASDYLLGKNLKALYVSKDASKSLMGQLLYCLYEGKEHTSNLSNRFCFDMIELKTNRNYTGIWDLCNIPENKSILQHTLSDIEVVVY